MEKCAHLETCTFFNDRLAGMPLLSDVLKEVHCFGDRTACARFIVALAGRPVPDDLFPDDNARASKIVGR